MEKNTERCGLRNALSSSGPKSTHQWQFRYAGVLQKYNAIGKILSKICVGLRRLRERAVEWIVSVRMLAGPDELVAAKKRIRWRLGLWIIGHDNLLHHPDDLGSWPPRRDLCAREDLWFEINPSQEHRSLCKQWRIGQCFLFVSRVGRWA